MAVYDRVPDQSSVATDLSTRPLGSGCYRDDPARDSPIGSDHFEAVQMIAKRQMTSTVARKMW